MIIHQKLNVLKLVLYQLQYDRAKLNVSFGLCCYVRCALQQLDMLEHSLSFGEVYGAAVESALTELGIMKYRPVGVPVDEFWWPVEDFDSRVAVIESCITEIVQYRLPLTLDKG